IFTRGRERQQQVMDLLRELIDLAENRLPESIRQDYLNKGTIPSSFEKNYRIIFVLREDYLAQLTGLRFYIPTINYSIFRLEQMTCRQAYEAIYRPTVPAALMDKATADLILNKMPDSQS